MPIKRTSTRLVYTGENNSYAVLKRIWSGSGLADQCLGRLPLSACMSAADGEHYFMGAFNGGRTKDFLQLSEDLALNIDTALKKGRVALWHDESY
ncbi:MAG: hypothetical protein J0H29_00275 [Sphingobacteriales bacterium]|mgnify:CR=1 FL=1|nr:hypothetical protein [Sphingobacteriales bacterium]